jgi:hypothetical protein
MLFHAAFSPCWKCLSHSSLVLDLERISSPQTPSLTFAISAQLLPASLIVFNLCSSAGVQGVFVRLFFAGGAIDPMFASSTLAVGGAGFDGPDMAGGDDAGPGARLLVFRGLPGAVVSGLMELSMVEVDGEPELGPMSARSPPRLDIERQTGRKSVESVTDKYVKLEWKV